MIATIIQMLYGFNFFMNAISTCQCRSKISELGYIFKLYIIWLHVMSLSWLLTTQFPHSSPLDQAAY
jgi:hypothetical protein